MGSNLHQPTVLEVTLGSHSSGSLIILRCKIGTRPWLGQSEMALRIHYAERKKEEKHIAEWKAHPLDMRDVPVTAKW